MSTPSKQLQNLTASDLMSQAVVVIPREMTLRGAARLFSRTRVTGAPVVDCEGHCVGVLSATDFMHFVEQNENCGPRHDLPQQEFYSASQLVDPEVLPFDHVAAYMTADPVTACAATRVADLAGMMVNAHIHRIVVVDEDRRPIGIVSSTDILAAVAQRGRADEPHNHHPVQDRRCSILAREK